MAKRLGLYFLGILILGFGIVLNTKTGLGVAAINSVPFGISEMTNLSLGMATTILYIIFVGVQLLIYQKLDFKVLLQLIKFYSYFITCCISSISDCYFSYCFRSICCCNVRFNS